MEFPVSKFGVLQVGSIVSDNGIDYEVLDVAHSYESPESDNIIQNVVHKVLDGCEWRKAFQEGRVIFP